jgi:DNA-binding PucR family transcriptional regulator
VAHHGGEVVEAVRLQPHEGGEEPRLEHVALDGAGLVGEHDGDVVALVAAREAGRAARQVAERLNRRALVTVGAAGPASDLATLPDVHAEAARTVAALAAHGRQGDGAAAADLGFAGLVVGSSPQIGQFVDSVLGPVVDYDGRRRTELLATLEAYFAAGSSPRHAADSLHVHVNTVAQRLERIGALLGPGWQQPERSLEVQLALRLRRLLPEA